MHCSRLFWLSVFIEKYSDRFSFTCDFVFFFLLKFLVVFLCSIYLVFSYAMLWGVFFRSCLVGVLCASFMCVCVSFLSLENFSSVILYMISSLPLPILLHYPSLYLKVSSLHRVWKLLHVPFLCLFNLFTLSFLSRSFTLSPDTLSSSWFVLYERLFLNFPSGILSFSILLHFNKEIFILNSVFKFRVTLMSFSYVFVCSWALSRVSWYRSSVKWLLMSSFHPCIIL